LPRCYVAVVLSSCLWSGLSTLNNTYRKLRLKIDLYFTAWLVRGLGAGAHQRKTVEIIEKVLEST